MIKLEGGTLYAYDENGNPRVLANGVDISYACVFDHEQRRVQVPDNLPEGCTVTVPAPWGITSARHHETARQRKTRETTEAAQRATARAAPQTEQVEEEAPRYQYALHLLTFNIWKLLYGDNTLPTYIRRLTA